MSDFHPQTERPASLPEQELVTTSDSPRRVIVRRLSTGEDEYANSNSGGCGFGCLKIFGVLAIVVVVVIVVVPIVIFGGIEAASNAAREMFYKVIMPPPPQATIVSSQSIVTGLQDFAQLVTFREERAKIRITISIRQGRFGEASFSATHAATGVFEAGIDLSLITSADINYDSTTNTYTVQLPHAQLTNCDVDADQYVSSTQLLRVDRDAARRLAEYVTLLEFREEVLEGGILIRAERQAELVFANLVKSLTGSETLIEFSERPPLPKSCEPDIPGSWRYDPAAQAWTQPE